MSEIYGTFSKAYVEAMRLRLSALEPENKDLLARLAALEAQAKQAREEEEWANERTVLVDFAPLENGWNASVWDGEKVITTLAPTIHAALRALRAKVEGGAR